MGNAPLYHQIATDLKNLIFSKELPPHAKLPTELELSKAYGVSRITSKRALTELENEKLIYRVRGKGSFVCNHDASQEQFVSNNILLVLPFPNNPDVGNYAQGILNFLQGSPYHLHVQSHDYLQTIGMDVLLRDYGGLILYPLSSNSHLDFFYPLHLLGFPLVLLDKQIEGLPVPTIASDNFQGGYLAAQALLESGRQKLSFLSFSQMEQTSSVRNRFLGFMKALSDSGLPLNEEHLRLSLHAESSQQEFFDEIAARLKDNGMTGVVAENDICAIHLMKALKTVGLKIPEDIALIGFDNIQASSLVEPSLSTVEQDFNQIGHLAAQILVALMEKKKKVPTPNPVPVQLILRESTKH